jgi:hypothetical protein
MTHVRRDFATSKLYLTCVHSSLNTITTQAKSQIVILGHLDKRVWTKSDCFSLSCATIPPMMTFFWSSLPVDAIPHINMSPDDHAPLIAEMQTWMGVLHWLQQCTCPDLATIFSLLASYMHCPSQGHLEAAKYLGRYILPTMDLWLFFTKQYNATLESFIHFPSEEVVPNQNNNSTLTTFCVANWGPQDASHP